MLLYDTHGGQTCHQHQTKPNRMSDVDFMAVLFYSGGFRYVKHYYQEYVCKHLTHLFPKRVSYNRFLEKIKGKLCADKRYIEQALFSMAYKLNTADIAAIAVVRGKAAVALYGERYVDGVMEITTKKAAAKQP